MTSAHEPHPRLADPPDWLAPYAAVPPRQETPREAIEWLISRPESVKAVLRRLPPACVVVLPCGCRGIVASVFEDGGVSVRPNPWTKDRYRIPPDVAANLVPEVFYAGQDVEWVTKILGNPRGAE